MRDKAKGRRFAAKLPSILMVLILALAVALTLTGCLGEARERQDLAEGESPIVEEATPGELLEEALPEEITGEDEDQVAGTTVEEDIEEPAETDEVELTDTVGVPLRAAALLDSAVVNAEDETLGQIVDLMIGSDNGRVNYVVISFREELNLEQELYAVPVSALQPDVEQQAMILEAGQERLQDAPGFAADNWPQTGAADWTEPVDAFWGTGDQAASGAQPAALEIEGDRTAIRASQLLQYQVVDPQGAVRGQIEDVLINPASGQVNYIVVVSSGDPVVTREGFHPLPVQAFTVDPEAEQIQLKVERDVYVEGPLFNLEEWPEALDPDWELPIREYWQNLPPEMLDGEGQLHEGPAPEEPAEADANEQEGQQRIDEPAIRVTDFLDYDVVNTAGEDLGELENLIIGLQSEQAKYAVFSFGGFLDAGETLFAVPWQALSLDPETALITLDIPEETLADAPQFDPADWPELVDSAWEIQIRDFWAENLPLIDGASEPADVQILAADEPAIAAADLLEYDVINADLEEIADFEDLTIGLESGRINYSVISSREFLGLVDEKLFAVPMSALEVDPLRGAVIFDVDEETLENAPGFDEDSWPNTADPRWDIDSSEYWQRLGYWPPVPAPTAATATRAMDETAIQASTLLDYEVLNLERETIGAIEDLMIGVPSGQVIFAAVSFEGVEGVGDELYAVPLNNLLINARSNSVTFNLADEQPLAEAPSFTSDSWPDVTDSAWLETFREYWLLTPVIQEPGVRASQLLDYELIGLEGGDLGQIEDLLIGISSNFVNYAVVSLDTAEIASTAGSGAELYPVPFEQLAVNLEEGVAVSEVSPELLSGAPRFEANNWPDLITPGWDVDYRAYWGSGYSPAATAMVSRAIVGEAGLRGSFLMDLDVENLLGERLGEIEDLIINLDDEQVRYAVLESDQGLLGLNEQLYLIPIDALAINPVSGVANLDLAAETLEDAPSFEADNWLTLSDPAWNENYWAYWEGFFETIPGVSLEEGVDGPAALSETMLRASELLAYEVENLQEEDLGDIDDFVIGRDSNRVNYVVLSFGGFLGLGEKLFAVPLSSLTIDYDNRSIILDVAQERLEAAPGFEADNWPDTANPDWDIEAREFWQNP